MHAERRKTVLDSARRIVIKVGSAVLTSERGLDLRVVNRLADQLAQLHDSGREIVLVSSGAVAAGRRRVPDLASGPLDLPGRQAVSAIGQSRLMHEYDEALARYDKVTAQVLLTREDFRGRQRFLNARNTMRRLLDWGVIPVINENDTVAVQELEFGDNDTLACMVVDLIGADLFVNLTSADGVFDKNPDRHPDAACVRCIDNIAALDLDAMCDGKTTVGSGGMYSKLRAARRCAQIGVPTLIVSGKHPFALEHVFAGAEAGTWVEPESRPIADRKFWLAYHDEPSGDIAVDAGAARALRDKGTSLLPIGIVEIHGRFERGALVRIKDPDGRTVGVGLSNYKSSELARIKGRNSGEIESVLGSAPYPEAVHRDNLLLDAAL